MQQVDGVWQLKSFPPHAFNVYLAEDVVIDAAHRRAGSGLFAQPRDTGWRRTPSTHCHADHNGVNKQICERFDAPFWVGERTPTPPSGRS